MIGHEVVSQNLYATGSTGGRQQQAILGVIHIAKKGALPLVTTPGHLVRPSWNHHSQESLTSIRPMLLKLCNQI